RSGRSLAAVNFLSRANLILSDNPAAARALMRMWIAVSLWNTYPRWDSYFNYTPEWDQRFEPIKTFIERHGAKPRNVSDFALIATHSELISDDLVHDAALSGTVE